MKNKKGFTLIELLAVIVILAIIALIATPIILNMIDNAKKGAAKDSAYGYIEAIDFQNSMSGIDNEKYKMVGPGDDLDVNSLDVKVKGSKPESGKVTIDKSGRVINAELCINNYTVKYDGKTATTGTKCGKTEEIVYVKEPIIEKAKKLVYKDGTCKTDGITYSYMGGCYIKGASTNNYVWYNGFMWRIMGINSDNTVRLITDENVTAISYGASNTAESYVMNEDYIHDWLNEYFLSHLNSTKSIIKEGNYFCSESTNSTTLTNATVRDKCTSGKEVSAKVGLISYDEYYLAGLSSSYLNIKQVFWTMTPYSTSNAWIVHSTGRADYYDVTNAFGVRPVINVEATSTITEGDGTTSSYYVLAEDKNSDKTGNIGNAVTSGEYVSLEGKTYRVVSKESDGVKLILDGYYDTNVKYGDNNTFTTTSGIGSTLNDDVLIWLGLNNSTKIKETAWYQGTAMSSGYTYKTPLTETEGTGITAKVGLIRVGEMLSGQSSTILTSNYTKTSSYSNAKNYWTMNQYTRTSSAWFVSDTGHANINGVTSTYGVRPVIKVDTTLTISKGNGTPSNPYEI